MAGAYQKYSIFTSIYDAITKICFWDEETNKYLRPKLQNGRPTPKVIAY